MVEPFLDTEYHQLTVWIAPLEVSRLRVCRRSLGVSFGESWHLPVSPLLAYARIGDAPRHQAHGAPWHLCASSKCWQTRPVFLQHADLMKPAWLYRARFTHLPQHA